MRLKRRLLRKLRLRDSDSQLKLRPKSSVFKKKKLSVKDWLPRRKLLRKRPPKKRQLRRLSVRESQLKRKLLQRLKPRELDLSKKLLRKLNVSVYKQKLRPRKSVSVKRRKQKLNV